MKKVITLKNQHFLKKNYIYNFFRSSIRFNAFFLKNNFFLFKFYKLLKFFFFTSFFLNKKIQFSVFNISVVKTNKSLFLKKNKSNLYSSYGNNYMVFNTDHKNKIYKFNSINPTSTNINSLIFNYNNILNFNILFNTLVFFNIK